jgi:hypothetical protein
MVETKERATGSPDVSGLTAELRPISVDSRAPRWRSLQSSLRTRSQVDAPITPIVSRRRQIGHFVRHYFEMCLPMCVGFAVGDLVYFWAAMQFGHDHPFTQLPELSVLIVTLNMTVPMTAWMLFRRMPRRPTVEMTAAMPILAVVLLVFGWLAVLPKGDLALLEHGLMMPVMLIPMLFRLDVYTGRTSHMTPNPHAAHT